MHLFPDETVYALLHPRFSPTLLWVGENLGSRGFVHTWSSRSSHIGFEDAGHGERSCTSKSPNGARSAPLYQCHSRVDSMSDKQNRSTQSLRETQSKYPNAPLYEWTCSHGHTMEIQSPVQLGTCATLLPNYPSTCCAASKTIWGLSQKKHKVAWLISIVSSAILHLGN